MSAPVASRILAIDFGRGPARAPVGGDALRPVEGRGVEAGLAGQPRGGETVARAPSASIASQICVM